MVCIEKTCPFCGSVTKVSFEDGQFAKYQMSGKVQYLNNKNGAFDREVVISGLCYNCQEQTFNRPAPGNEDKWGKHLGDCGICGSPIWEKDIKGDTFNCSCCYETYEVVKDDDGRIIGFEYIGD